jgi:hypothetical protein
LGFQIGQAVAVVVVEKDKAGFLKSGLPLSGFPDSGVSYRIKTNGAP